MSLSIINNELCKFIESTENQYRAECTDKVNKFFDVNSRQLNLYLSDSSMDEVLNGIPDLPGCENYFTYGESLVINVKGRPKIDFDSLHLNLEAPNIQEKYNLAIQHFMKQCEDKYSNFTTEGRSDGYWGMMTAQHFLNLSDKGVQTIIDGLCKNNILLDDIEETLLTPDWWADTLLTDMSNFEFDQDYIQDMHNLVKDIDEMEAQMNTREFWNE